MGPMTEAAAPILDVTSFRGNPESIWALKSCRFLFVDEGTRVATTRGEGGRDRCRITEKIFLS